MFFKKAKKVDSFDKKSPSGNAEVLFEYRRSLLKFNESNMISALMVSKWSLIHGLLGGNKGWRPPTN